VRYIAAALVGPTVMPSRIRMSSGPMWCRSRLGCPVQGGGAARVKEGTADRGPQTAA
jgi:hypothetical protein